MRRLGRYVVVGLTANGLGVAVFEGLVRLGLAPEAASFAAFFPSFGCAYLLNRRWSFGSALPHGAALPRYVLATAAAVGVQIGLVALFFRVFGLRPVAAQVLAIGIATPLSYLLLRFWVFAEASASRASSRASLAG